VDKYTEDYGALRIARQRDRRVCRTCRTDLAESSGIAFLFWDYDPLYLAAKVPRGRFGASLQVFFGKDCSNVDHLDCSSTILRRAKCFPVLGFGT